MLLRAAKNLSPTVKKWKPDKAMSPSMTQESHLASWTLLLPVCPVSLHTSLSLQHQTLGENTRKIKKTLDNTKHNKKSSTDAIGG